MEKEINSNFEGNKHGISEDRLIESTPNEIAICPHCKKIFWEPQMCSITDCGITFCQPCLKNSLQKGETCSGCQKGTKYEPNSFLKNRFLSKLKFKCINSKECKSTLNYDELPFHICPYDKVKCEIKGCSWIGTRKVQPEHIIICPFEVLECSNEGCRENIKRGEMLTHKEGCRYGIVTCPKKCGFNGFRYSLEEHVNHECPLVKVACQYNFRGCIYTPNRVDLQSHSLSCLYQPKVLKCGHEVNLKELEEHEKSCSEYPLSCEKCLFTFKRVELVQHQCLPFLLNKIAILEEKYRILETKLEKSEDQEKEEVKKVIINLERIENKMDETPILCPSCTNLKQRKGFEECTTCEGIFCMACISKCFNCSKVYCYKNDCSSIFAQFITCRKCNQELGSCCFSATCDYCGMSDLCAKCAMPITCENC